MSNQQYLNALLTSIEVEQPTEVRAIIEGICSPSFIQDNMVAIENKIADCNAEGKGDKAVAKRAIKNECAHQDEHVAWVAFVGAAKNIRTLKINRIGGASVCAADVAFKAQEETKKNEKREKRKREQDEKEQEREEDEKFRRLRKARVPVLPLHQPAPVVPFLPQPPMGQLPSAPHIYQPPMMQFAANQGVSGNSNSSSSTTSSSFNSEAEVHSPSSYRSLLARGPPPEALMISQMKHMNLSPSQKK